MKKTLALAAFILLQHLAIAQIDSNVTLLDRAFDASIPLNGLQIRYNDCWGFVQNSKEYAVIGSASGTHFYEVTDADTFRFIQYVPGKSQNVVHRDYHDYNGYLYGVCDQGQASLQIFDLAPLPDSVSLVYNSDSLVKKAHNIFIDSSSAKAYICGPSIGNSAIRILDISNPTAPSLLFDHTAEQYAHDCFVRNDTAYINAGTEGLFIYDFSNTTNPVLLGSLTSYPDQGYNHSGWLNANGTRYVLADETFKKRMKLLDVSDLTDIKVNQLFASEVDTAFMPHNVMIKDNIIYVSHYEDGLRIYELTDSCKPKEIAFYDTAPDKDGYYDGNWGVYAFLPSGRILLSDEDSGLFVVETTFVLDSFNCDYPMDTSQMDTTGMDTTGMDSTNFVNEWFNENDIWVSENSLYVNSTQLLPLTLKIYDLQARLISEIQINNRSTQLTLTPSMYIFHFQKENSYHVGKFLISR